MNSRARQLGASLLALVLALPISAEPFSMRAWSQRRFHPEYVQVHDVEGIDARLANGTLQLSLHDFLALVLRNSTDIRLTQLDVYTAADAITAAEAPFDPTLLFSFQATRSLQPEFNQTTGAETLNSLLQTSQASYAQLLGAGPAISANFSATRSSSNSSFDFFNPSIFNSLNLTIDQPLLQGRGNLQQRAPIQIAKTQLLITSELTEARIGDTIATAALQYWEAIRLRETVRVLQQSQDLAQKSYEHDRKALELGALSRLDIFQSESQVAQRKLDVIQAQFVYAEQLDLLRRDIGADLKPQSRDIPLELTENPSVLPTTPLVQPIEETLAKAMHDRPELTAANRRISIDDLNAKVARNALQPRLDLQVIAGSSGLGGNQIPVTGLLGGGPTTFVQGGLGDALGQLFTFGTPSYGAGITLGIPFRSSAAKASLADAQVNRTRDAYTQRQLQQQIILEVKTANNDLQLAKASVEAATNSRELARQNVEAEQKKYELGTVTAFELLDSQNRLAIAESSVVNAHVSYQKALISYQRASWTILDGMGAAIQIPNRPR